MPPLVVEPEELAGAGVSIAGVSDELASALSTLAAGLPGGAMAGHDTAGLAFGAAYQQAGQALLDAGAAAVNGGRKVGFGVQVSATNYSRADASSTIGGGAGALTPRSAPGEVDAPAMSSPFGGGVAEPFLWSMVEMLVGGVWPDGDPAQLRAAAGAWSTFARTLSGIGAQLQGPSATIAGQQIPEGEAMATALSDLTNGLTDITTESVKLATQTFEFADDVESAQNAIRDLLSRLSPSGIFDGLGAIFSGDAMEELREIADDIRTVLDNLKRQADARRGSMDDVMQMIDDAVVSLQRKARREFTDYLGDDVGNAVATTFDTSLNVREGLLKGGIGALQDFQELNPLRFAYDFEGAKDTWGGMLETNFNASLLGSIIDPDRAADTQVEMLKGLVHAEDWTTDRPGLGAGENLFDVGSALIGGAGAARSGTRAAGEAAEAAEGAAPGVRAAGALDSAVTETSGIAGRVEGIADDLGKIGDDIPEGAAPNPSGPAVPRDVAEPPPLAAQATDTTRSDGESATRSSTPPDAAHAHIGEDVPAVEAPSISAGSESRQPLADLSSGNDRSSPALSTSPSPASSAPAQAPSPVPEAAAPILDDALPTPGGAPNPPGHLETHGLNSDGSNGSGRSDNVVPERADSDNGVEVHHPLSEDPVADAGGQPPDGPLSDEKRDEILSMEKGARPDPSEYLSPEYIEQHLQKFDDGASRFMPVENLDKYGLAQRDGTSFVMPANEINRLMDATKGDPRAMEQALGWPEGFLDKHNVVRIDIPGAADYNLRMPSGNEAGANEHWLPGGMLPGDLSEAVIDGDAIPDTGYTIIEIQDD